MTNEQEFVRFSADKLEQLCDRICVCLDKLTADQIWTRHSNNENAAGNLVLHLCGNVRQWIISGVGGAPDHRQRDAEFAARGSVSPAELKERLRSTVTEATSVIRGVTAERLGNRILPQNYDVTVLEAVYHVVEHFALHAGQVMFVTKFLTSEDLGFYKHLKAATHSEKTP